MIVLTCERCRNQYLAAREPADGHPCCTACRSIPATPPPVPRANPNPSPAPAQPQRPSPPRPPAAAPSPVPLAVTAPARRRAPIGAVAWLLAIALNAALVLVLRPSAASVPPPSPATAEGGLTVRLADPPSQRLSKVVEAPLQIAAPVGVGGRVDDADGLLVQALGSLPVAGSSGLLNVGSGTVPVGEFLVPLGSSTTSLRFDGDISLTGGKIADGSWNGLIRDLRSRGLDIVIVFDATASMGAEINQVKAQINQIGTALLKLIPKTRISLVAYRDYGDVFVATGIPLTNDLVTLQRELARVQAGGGGDTPEAVHEGLRWALTHNTFLPKAKKVILIFGDAPPHPEYLPVCLAMASSFHKEKDGVVSTVTCRSGSKIDEFVQIAEAGGGESFFTTDTRSIMEQLMVLVFGSRHRDKVLEAFRLLDR